MAEFLHNSDCSLRLQHSPVILMSGAFISEVHLDHLPSNVGTYSREWRERLSQGEKAHLKTLQSVCDKLGVRERKGGGAAKYNMMMCTPCNNSLRVSR